MADDLAHGALDAAPLGGAQVSKELGVVLVRQRRELWHARAAPAGERQRCDMMDAPASVAVAWCGYRFAGRKPN